VNAAFAVAFGTFIGTAVGLFRFAFAPDLNVAAHRALLLTSTDGGTRAHAFAARLGLCAVARDLTVVLIAAWNAGGAGEGWCRQAGEAKCE